MIPIFLAMTLASGWRCRVLKEMKWGVLFQTASAWVWHWIHPADVTTFLGSHWGDCPRVEVHSKIAIQKKQIRAPDTLQVVVQPNVGLSLCINFDVSVWTGNTGECFSGLRKNTGVF